MPPDINKTSEPASALLFLKALRALPYKQLLFLHYNHGFAKSKRSRA
jgi:hypothetical protein